MHYPLTIFGNKYPGTSIIRASQIFNGLGLIQQKTTDTPLCQDILDFIQSFLKNNGFFHFNLAQNCTESSEMSIYG